MDARFYCNYPSRRSYIIYILGDNRYKLIEEGIILCFHKQGMESSLDFPQSGFWLVHIIGVLAVFYMGMRFAVRRVPLPIMMYRIFRMLGQR